MSIFQVWDARVLGVKWRKYSREDADIEVCKLNVEMQPCVCAVWLIGLPLAWHFHYLIAWKRRRGDCRSLAVWAERMDLECISIGSKAPAVGGCPRPWALHGSTGELCHLQPWQPPLQYSFNVALDSLKGLTNRTVAHTWSDSVSSPYLDVYREQGFATRPTLAGPCCSTSLTMIGAPAHLISSPRGPPWLAELEMSWAWKSGANHPWSLKPWEIVWY